MPKILAIETATEACSAALLISENEINTNYSRYELAPRKHTQLILPMIEEIFEESYLQLKDVDAIAFGRGPGAFTGLRIAAGIVQGLALSCDKPVLPVSTLAALALQAFQNEKDLTKEFRVIAGLDARMNEVYWGEFSFDGDDVISLIGVERVSSAEAMVQNLSDYHYIGIGSAWDAYQDNLLLDNSASENKNSKLSHIKIITNTFPSAITIAQLALTDFLENKSLNAEQAQPIYIRNNVAKKS